MTHHRYPRKPREAQKRNRENRKSAEWHVPYGNGMLHGKLEVSGPGILLHDMGMVDFEFDDSWYPKISIELST